MPRPPAADNKARRPSFRGTCCRHLIPRNFPCSYRKFFLVAGPPQLSPLPYSHIWYMGFHMKTTLNIDDQVMRALKREAARQGRTMSELVEVALRGLLTSAKKKNKLLPLPTFDSGGMLVDIANREALYDVMEGR